MKLGHTKTEVIILDINLQYENNRVFAQNESDETIAEITFPRISDHMVDIRRTYVHPSLRGQGVANQLMEAAMNVIQSNGLKATASCSYAIKWLSNHPEFKNLIEDPNR